MSKRKRRHRRSSLEGQIFGGAEHSNGFQVPDKIANPHPMKQRVGGKQYWYVKAKTTDAAGKSKHALLGPYGSEEEAQNMGYTKCDGQFELIQSRYSDPLSLLLSA